MLFQIPELDPMELEVIGHIERLKKELAYTVSPRRWEGLLRRNTFARALRGSNSIEGFHVTAEDAIAAVEGEEPLDAKTESWYAVAGYRMAMTFVLQKADDPFFSYSPGLFHSLHFMMMSYDMTKNPGRWRPGSIFVRDDATGEQIYEGPPLELVPGMIQELVDELNQPGDVPPLVQGAMSHLNLVMIHPFSDGNGRMARCLQTLVLARSGTLSPHFVSIEEYLGRNTREYYDVLAAVGGGSWRSWGAARPWVRFCLTAHFIQATTLLRRSRQIARIWDALELEIAKRGLPERSIFALADATTGLRVRNATYRSLADISEGVAARDLKSLVDAKLLIAHGEKRGRVYVASPQLLELRAKTSEPKKVEDPFKSKNGLGR